jgi:hypothetical protein
MARVGEAFMTEQDEVDRVAAVVKLIRTGVVDVSPDGRVQPLCDEVPAVKGDEVDQAIARYIVNIERPGDS